MESSQALYCHGQALDLQQIQFQQALSTELQAMSFKVRSAHKPAAALLHKALLAMVLLATALLTMALLATALPRSTCYGTTCYGTTYYGAPAAAQTGQTGRPATHCYANRSRCSGTRPSHCEGAARSASLAARGTSTPFG